MTIPTLPASAYELAEKLLDHNRDALVGGAGVVPRWLGDGARFWYTTGAADEQTWFLADPQRKTRARLADRGQLERAVRAARGVAETGAAEPVTDVRVTDDSIEFTACDERWRYDPASGACDKTGDGERVGVAEVASPDGRWVAFRRSGDIWVRSGESGEETRLTTDGTPDDPYAAMTVDRLYERRVLSILGRTEPHPALRWSPDSTKILTHRTDWSRVAQTYLVESAPPDGSRPALWTYRYALPGDRNLPTARWRILDVATRSSVAVEGDFVLGDRSPLAEDRRYAWWSPDGGAVYHVDFSVDRRTLALKRIDPVRGSAEDVIVETGSSHVDAHQREGAPPLVHVLRDGTALWFSQRDGWGHLYRYDLRSGALLNKVTDGRLVVESIDLVDEDEQLVFLTVTGLVESDPYRRTLVRCRLDGTRTHRVFDDDLDHQVVTPPHGRWLVDTASAPAVPGRTRVVDRDGEELMEVARADVSRLEALGWHPPQRFRTTSADGSTEIFGLLYLPPGFDPAASYPVVDHVYPGPQISRVRPGFDQGRMGCDAEAVAALGFVVMAVDGRGTPGRSKEFHDFSYRNIESAGGLDDHVAALRELAASRPWMDLNRVGIFGRSGGGYATVRAMLDFPSVYSVGVSEAGDHDNRMYAAEWGLTYQGPYDEDMYRASANCTGAERLRGRLLLVHGGMDDNVTVHQTFRLADRLIALNKDFDMLIVPGAPHSFFGYEPYVIRRRWDYLVRHLLDLEPPDYRLADGPWNVAAREAGLK